MKNRITPLERLHAEQAILRAKCAAGESRLNEHWVYVSDNIGPLLFSVTISGVKNMLGLDSSKHKKKEEENTNNTITTKIQGGLSLYAPFMWSLVQPLLINYAKNKILSIFTRKRKIED